MTAFAMFRIIGNALPPRHTLTDNIRAIEYIIRHEPRFENSRRIWLLNRILDPSQKAAMLEMLKAAGEETVDLPFDAAAHHAAFLDATGLPIERRLLGDVSNLSRYKPLELEWIVRHKSQALIGINSARNHALKLGRPSAEWTLVLDGGVVFSTEGWQAFMSGVRAGTAAKFAIIDLRRAFDWNAVGPSTKEDGLEEPQIAFHSSSTDLFDERLRYGNRNKVELLKRLGVAGPWQAWRSAHWDVEVPLESPDKGAYVRAGFVTRLPAGEEKPETASQRQRFVNRFVGVAQRSAEMDLQFVRARNSPAAQFTVGIPPAGHTRSSLALEQQVAAWLAEPDRFVTDKTGRDPGFDRHDYFSTAPYWSEDGQRFDGLVQDRRSPDDPESGHFDRASMLRFMRKVYGLSLAGRLLGRRELFATAASLLRAWFLDPATRMNPTMRHAQMIPGKTEVNAVGIIEFREYSYLPYAITLLAREGALGKTEIQGIRSWFRQFITDCDRSGVVASALGRRNNIGTWAVAVLGSMALFIQDLENSHHVVRMSSIRLGMQLGALSLQPHETERTRPLHYSLFNLSGWWSVMRLGKEFGIDLERYSGIAGESLPQAVAMCSDNRHRFCDYHDNEAAFDTWIGLLQQLFSPAGSGEPVQVVDNLYWGLPPVILRERI